MRRFAIPTLIAASLALAGCSAATPEDSSSPTSPAPASSSTPSAPSPGLKKVLGELDADAYQPSSAPFTTDYGTATYHDESIQLYAFASTDDYEDFLDAVKSAGVSEDDLITVDLGEDGVVAIAADDSLHDQIQDDLDL